MKSLTPSTTLVIALMATAIGCGSVEPLTEPERCDFAGGEWTGDPCNGAYWRCDYSGTCVTAIGEGCDCGVGACWDGERCVQDDRAGR